MFLTILKRLTNSMETYRAIIFSVSAIILLNTVILPRAFSADNNQLPEVSSEEEKLHVNVTGQDNNPKFDSSYLFSENIEANFGIAATLNNRINNDILVRAGLKVLFDSKSAGAAISIEKGSEFQKIIATLVTGYKGGQVKVSVAHLEKMMDIQFDAFEWAHNEKLTQKAAGLEINHPLGDTFQNIRFNINYFSVDNVDLGKIGEIVIDNANIFDLTHAYGAIKGGEKTQTGLDFDIKIDSVLKLVLGGGLENIEYNDAYTSGETYTQGFYKAKVVYQPDYYNKLSTNYIRNDTFEEYSLSYIHDFGNKFNTSLSLSNTRHYQGLENDTQAIFSLNYTFDGKASSKLNDLFKTQSKDNSLVSLADLTHSTRINTNQIHIAKKDYHLEHIAYVDKVGTNSTVEYNNTNVTVKTTLGVVNLTNGSINDASHPNSKNYSSQFTIENNGTLVVSSFEALPFGEHRLLIQELGGTFTIIKFIVTEGSKELRTAPEKKSGLSLIVAQSYINGSKSFSEIVASPIDASTFATPPSFDSKTTSTINTTIGTFTDTDGVQNVTVGLYSDAGLGTLLQTSVSGDFTGLTTGTTYYLSTIGEALNATTSVWQAKKSASLSVTTGVPDASTFATPPSFDSKTTSTINTTIGTFTDTDGVQNVTVGLYSDAGLVTLLQTSVSGDFTGLTTGTTYYLSTIGEALNATTSVWQAKKSASLMQTTN